MLPSLLGGLKMVSDSVASLVPDDRTPRLATAAGTYLGAPSSAGCITAPVDPLLALTTVIIVVTIECH